MTTFLEFITEKKKKLDTDRCEDKFKDVDCSKPDDLTEEEKTHCSDINMLDFINKVHAGNN